MNSIDCPTDFKITDSETDFNTRLHKFALNILKNDRGYVIRGSPTSPAELHLNQFSFTSAHSWYDTNVGLLSTLHKEKLESFANLPRQIFIAEDQQPFRKIKPTKD